MVPGDISIFTTSIGQKLVAIVLHQNEDGTYAVFCPKPTFNSVEAVGGQAPGTLFDPTLPEPTQAASDAPSNRGDVVDAPAAPDVVDAPPALEQPQDNGEPGSR